MKTFSKISLAIFILALAALAIIGFPIIKDRYSNLKAEDKTEESKEKIQTKEETAEENFNAPVQQEEIDEEEKAEDEDLNDTFVQVSPEDCKNECKNFQDPEDVTYCKQTCGLVTPQKNVTGCEAKEDLEKDYCYKDEAISKTDPKICDKIEDAGIKKTCKNRLIEDIVDQQMIQQ